MISSIFKLTGPLALLCTLSACGGGSDSPAPDSPDTTEAPIVDETIEKSLVKGKVIDGYVSGATVWLDINGNGIKDDNEPSTKSEAAGDYGLELNDEERACLPYATLYVDVPVGAIDESEGPVTEAYQMAYAPTLGVITQDDLVNISPLTTAVWDQLDFSNVDFGSCSELIANASLREQLADAISTSIFQTATAYNISADKIYSDFIADGDTELQALAVSFVTGLKASFKYNLALKEQYPDAIEVRAVHYQSNTVEEDGDDLRWYRDIIVFEVDGHFSRLERLNQELTQVERVIYDRVVENNDWQNGLYKTQADAYSYRGDAADYNCSFSESVSFSTADINYIFDNALTMPDAKQYDTCDNTTQSTDRRRLVTFDYTQDNILFTTRFDKYSDNGVFTDLNHWQQLKENEAQLPVQEVVDYYENTGFKFDEDVQIELDYWYKSKYYYEGDNTINITKDIDGNWDKRTMFPDGTYLDECSADAGETWSIEACE